MSYFEEEEFQELLEQYEQSLEQGNTPYMDAEDLTDIAEYYMMRADVEKADECIGIAVSLHPDAIDPQVFLARQQLFYGNVKQAYAILNDIVDQKDREVLFLRAELLLKEGKVEEASRLMRESYEEIIKEDRHLFLYDTSDILYEYGFYEEARKWAQDLQQQYPNYHEAFMLMGDIQMKLGNYEAAQHEGERMLETDSFNQNAWMLTAEALALQEKSTESLEATEFLLAINEKHPEAMLARASNLFFLNRIEEAHQQYVEYLASYPDEYYVLYLDGVCLTNLDRNKEAKEILLRALEVSNTDAPERVHIHLQLAYVLSKMHEMEDALDNLEACRNYPEPENAIDYNLVKGHILLENEELEQAERHFNLAVEQSKTPLETLFLIAITMGETGHYTQSSALLLQLHDSPMEQAAEKTSPYLAYCYLFLGQDDLFLKYLKEAAEMNPNTTQFLFSQYYPGIPVSGYYEKAKEMVENKDKR